MDENTKAQTSYSEDLKKFFKWQKVKGDNEAVKSSVVSFPDKKDSVNTLKTKTKWNRTTIEQGIVPPIPNELIYATEIKQYNENKKEKLTRRALNNPLVPMGMAATVTCLIGMCVSCIQRDRKKTQMYMRGRVAAQFFTFCVLVGGACYMGKKLGNKDGEILKRPSSDLIGNYLRSDKSFTETVTEYVKN